MRERLEEGGLEGLEVGHPLGGLCAGHTNDNILIFEYITGRMRFIAIPLPKLVQSLSEGYSLEPSPATDGWRHGRTGGACPLRWRSRSRPAYRRRTGIYCAVVAGFMISALGGSASRSAVRPARSSSWSPGSSRPTAIDGLFMCTLMAGVMLVVLGITGLGTAVKYIPRPVVIGFTNGIGVLIASTQIRDLFGFRSLTSPAISRPHATCRCRGGHRLR